MKILIYITLILAPVLSFSQVSVYTKAQSDSAINAAVTTAIKKIVFPSATIDNAAVQKMIDASFAKLDSVVVKSRITAQANFVNLDTIKIGVNTSCYIDLIITANQLSNNHSSMSHYEVLLSNTNGVYSLERWPNPLGQDGLLLKGTQTTYGIDPKYGLVLFATPGTASPILWIELINIKKISK